MKNNHKLSKFFWECIKPYWLYYLLMALAPILGGFYISLNSYVVKMLIDMMTVNVHLSFSNLIAPIGLFIFAQAYIDIIWRVSNFAEWKSEPYVRKAVLTKAFAYVQQHSYSYFQNNHIGTITSKIKGILIGYDNVASTIHHKLLTPFSSFIITTFALSIVNIWLGVFVFIWSILFVITMYKLTGKLSKYSNIVSESKHRLFGIIADNISNIITTKIFNIRGDEFEKLKSEFDKDTIPKEVAMYKYDFKVQIVASIFYWLLLTSILIVMIYLKNNELITLGDFAFVFGIIFAASDQLWHAILNLRDLHASIGDLKQSFTILEDKHELLDKQNANNLLITNGKIEFKNVNFGYSGDQLVLSNFNLTIHPGEKIGLVGISGVGKSTIISLLLRFFKVTSGEILIDEQNINNITERSLYDSIAIVPQDIMLFHRSIQDNIKQGNVNATNEDIKNAVKKAYAQEFIEKFPNKYDTIIGERGIKISVGQRQRIAIARALLKNSPILIFDEATSALDSITEKYIQKTTQDIIRKSDKTMIVIAHRLSTLKNLDRIIVVDGGMVIEEGTHKELVAKNNGKYNNLWKLQSDFFIF
jgi:ATP-binding cassette, subfamily B, bacterial